MTLQRNALIARLIRARLRGGGMLWIILPALTYIAGVIAFVIIPSYFSGIASASRIIASLTVIFGVFLGLSSYLQQGIYPAHFISGASRKDLMLSGWAITLINTTIGVTLWVITHLVSDALPWQINLETSNSITQLSLVTLFLVNFGVFSRLAVPYWARGATIRNFPHLFPLAIPTYFPMVLLFGMNSISPAILPWLVLFDIPVTIGLAWWLWRTESRFTYTT